MTYDERVQALAEKMAQATCKKMAAIDGSDLTWKDAGKEEQELFIETHVPAARIAVAEIEAEVEKLLSASGLTCFIIGEYLKEHGLIPE